MPVTESETDATVVTTADGQLTCNLMLVPQGTKYVVTQLYTTAAATVVVDGRQA